MRRAWAVMLLVFAAGCLDGQDPAPSKPADPPQEPTLSDEAMPIVLGDCVEVSGVSVYPIDQYRAVGPPSPWVAADISADIGDPTIGSAGGIVPPVATEGIAGHWHSAIGCAFIALSNDGETFHIGLEKTWGFVGIDVEAPPFDTGGADRHVLLAVWSWPMPEARAYFHAFAHATATESATAEAEPVASMVLDDADHGRYEGASPVVADGAVPERVTRFWMLIPTEGHPNHHDQVGPFRPVSIDMASSALQRDVSPETMGAFAHTQTDHHAPLPGLGGNAVMVVHSTFDAVIVPGPAPDIQLNETWVH